jgi:hypothetical protein
MLHVRVAPMHTHSPIIYAARATLEALGSDLPRLESVDLPAAAFRFTQT